MRRLLAVLLFGLLPSGSTAAGPVAQLAERILDAGLDAGECYRVHDLQLIREELRVFLGNGFLVFGKPVQGAPLTAVFSADIEGGDAEVMLFPPTQAERLSLANYTGSPNLDEHFRSAVLVFTDETYAQLLEQIKAKGPATKSSEMGLVLSQAWEPVVRNLSASFQARLVKDLLSGGRSGRGVFYGALGNSKLGHFDILYDPRMREQIVAGQVVFRENNTFFDVWTRFAARSTRNQSRETPPEVAVSNFRIDATLEPDLRLRVITRATIVPGPEARGALTFELSRRMKVTEARLDGEPADVFQPETMRASLIRGGVNDVFLVIPAKELKAGQAYQIEFRHEGEVVSDAGNQVYYVGARGSWYPNAPLQFARYDLTFRYPKDLGLVSTGQIVEDGRDGMWRITRRSTDTAIRMAGFNLGDYERRTASRAGLTVEVYANRRVERALEPRRDQVVFLPPLLPPRSPTRPGELIVVSIEPPPPNPLARLQSLASEIAACFEFMASHFGPPPLKTLTVAPIPASLGQGFPGLVYLSTMSYLEPRERPAAGRGDYQQSFYSEILHAHETAHQWWGNVVIPASYQDDWMMEALANYSALLFLEKRKGTRALDEVLNVYKEHLLAKRDGGETVESSGPIVWGLRLSGSQSPGAWRTITYEKGSWIIHMLRRRLGDERFLAMLGELRRRFEYRAVSTQDFRRLAAAFLPPKSPDPALEAFFDQWVYGTGIPALKLSYSIRGKAPAIRLSGTVTQSEVNEDFSALAPVEIQVGRAKPRIEWVRTGTGGASFSLTLRQAPAKVLLDPSNSVLRR